jgi:hypothetical protein
VGKSLRNHPDRGEMVSPQDRPPNITMINEIMINEITINEITMESNEMEKIQYNVMSRKDLEAEVQTMYKRKDKKVHPANTPLPDGVNPGGNVMSEMTGNEGLGRETESGGKKVPRDT